jgi:hypothetical protein
MPIHSGFIPVDVNGVGGYFYQWGNHGKKYFYDPNDSTSENDAYILAAKQSAAAHASGYKGK